MKYQIQSVNDITKDQRNEIITLLISGEFPVDSDIAKIVHVPTKVVTELIRNDPELAELRKQGEMEMAQFIEKAAFNLAINGKNEIARQKSQEFMLKKLMPEKYGDDAVKSTGISAKRINITLKLPEVKVDANGIPIQTGEKNDMIDV